MWTINKFTLKISDEIINKKAKVYVRMEVKRNVKIIMILTLMIVIMEIMRLSKNED